MYLDLTWAEKITDEYQKTNTLCLHSSYYVPGLPVSPYFIVQGVLAAMNCVELREMAPQVLCVFR